MAEEQRVTLTFLTFRDKDGREWTANGFLGPLEPVGHDGEDWPLDDSEPLGLKLIGFKVVT